MKRNAVVDEERGFHGAGFVAGHYSVLLYSGLWTG